MHTTVFAALALLILLTHGNIINQCNQSGMLAMTIDDGPATYTGQLLDILSQKGVRATFHITTKFLTDPNVQATVQRIAAGGHLIGLRTESNWNLLTMSDDQIRSSIARQANVLSSFIGYYPKFVRLPYNGYDDRVVKAVESTGAVVTTHNLESYDYTNDGNRVANAFQLSLSLFGNGEGNFISLQHDSSQQSVSVTPAIIDTIKKHGYNIVTLDRCLGMGDMTKNKSPLKGGNGPAAPIALSSPVSGDSPSKGSSGPTDLSDDANGVAGQTAKGRNDATHCQASTLALTFAVLFSCVVSFTF